MAREMKNSGVQWMGEIPHNWIISRLKFLSFRLRSGGTPKADNIEFYAEEGGIPWVVIADMSAVNFVYDTEKHLTQEGLADKKLKIYPSGTLLYSIYATLGKVAELKVPAAINQAILAVTLRPNYIQSYCKYALKAQEDFVVSMASTNTQANLNAVKVANYNMPVPPLLEQKAIADFLDIKCGEIDGLLADLDAEVKTLGEYKKSIIAETVTRGLNPNAQMMPSGIPWADTIPAHWKCKKGKYTFQLLQRPVKDNDGVITCFRDGEVTLRSNRREDGFTMSEKEYGYQGIEPGDLVVHGMDGFAGSIGISDSRGKATPVLNVLDSNHNKRYLMYYLRNMAYGNVFLALSTGIRVRSCDLSWKKLGEIRIVLPPLDEQIEIANYLDSKCDAIDQAITDKTQQIETLKAYKSSLIYEYVTGKKQVL